MTAALGTDTRLVVLQFSFSNPDAIPTRVKRLEQETNKERQERKSHSTGVMVIEPTTNCHVNGFLGELTGAGYELVDAFTKERIDPKDPRGIRTYHVVRFVFCHKNHVDCSEEFRTIRDEIFAELSEMTRVAMWRVRVFSNPFYQNDEEIPGVRTVSANFEARTPLYLPDGNPVVMWQKDQAGKRVGDRPIPIKPAHVLRLDGNTIVLS